MIIKIDGLGLSGFKTERGAEATAACQKLQDYIQGIGSLSAKQKEQMFALLEKAARACEEDSFNDGMLFGRGYQLSLTLEDEE